MMSGIIFSMCPALTACAAFHDPKGIKFNRQGRCLWLMSVMPPASRPRYPVKAAKSQHYWSQSARQANENGIDYEHDCASSGHYGYVFRVSQS